MAQPKSVFKTSWPKASKNPEEHNTLTPSKRSKNLWDRSELPESTPKCATFKIVFHALTFVCVHVLTHSHWGGMSGMLLQPWQGSKRTGPFREERLSLSRRMMKTIRKKPREKRPENTSQATWEKVGDREQLRKRPSGSWPVVWYLVNLKQWDSPYSPSLWHTIRTQHVLLCGSFMYIEPSTWGYPPWG